MSSLHRRHLAVSPDWLALYYKNPLEITHGEGRHVWDADGRRYLDFFGGILTTMTAHALPEVTKAVSEQAGRIIHSSTLYLNRPMVELAERVATLSGIPDARVFFTTSGTEANDTALLLATAYRGSNQILAMRNSYHGRSFSAVSITGNNAWSPTNLSPLQTLYVHGGVRTRGPYAHLGDGEFIAACVADLEDLLGHTRTPAALIAEPIQGVGGFTSPPDGLYAAFRRVLDRHGILWISDEVQTGWGRSGEHFWGWQAHGENGPPDILTFAKGIGNGMSIGGVVARADVMNCLDANSISTFGGSPVTMASKPRQPLVPPRTRSAGQRPARRRTADRAAARDRRGLGVRTGGARPWTDDRHRAGEARHRRGEPGGGRRRARSSPGGRPAPRQGGGHNTSVLRIAPPLSLTIPEAEEGAEILAGALRTVG